MMGAQALDNAPLVQYFIEIFGWNLPESVYWVMATVFLVFCLILPQVAWLSFLEQKLTADLENRIGPHFAGKYGALQFLADFLSSMSKPLRLSLEQLHRRMLKLFLAIAVCFSAVGLIPFSEHWNFINLQSEFFIILTIFFLLSFLKFWMSTFSENNFTRQFSGRSLEAFFMSSTPLVTSLIIPTMITNRTNLNEIVLHQSGFPNQWIAFSSLSGFVSFVTCYFALSVLQNIAPFSPALHAVEIQKGYYNDFFYSRGSLVALLERLIQYLSLSILVTLYLGGWTFPFSLNAIGKMSDLVQFLFFSLKVSCLFIVQIWVQASFPLMNMSQATGVLWRLLMPLNIFAACMHVAFAFIRNKSS